MSPYQLQAFDGVFSPKLGCNARFYQGYKPEDFIGRISTVAQAGNNANVEYIAMKRFYLGYLGFCTKICFPIVAKFFSLSK